MRRVLVPVLIACAAAVAADGMAAAADGGAFGLAATRGSGAAQGRPRIVAVGDVHGAAEAFAAILTAAGLIDSNKQWIGGRAVLVQTGDVTDRGAGTRAALDLLMSLEKQAAKAGGRVHAVLGNHEVMNLTGEMRDATPEIFASFGGEAAMREAFGPEGHYGRWLRTKPIIASVDDTIFMHAGISPAESTQSISDLNNRVKRDVEQWDAGVRLLQKLKLVPGSPEFNQVVSAARAEIERLNALVAAGEEIPSDAPRVAAALLPLANIGESSLFAVEGPLWFRGYATWTEEEGAPQVAALLKRYRARRFVTGHSPQRDGRITERFGGAMFLIDTGMLGKPYFPTGRPSALVIEADSPRALYLPDPQAALRRAGAAR